MNGPNKDWMRIPLLPEFLKWHLVNEFISWSTHLNIYKKEEGLERPRRFSEACFKLNQSWHSEKVIPNRSKVSAQNGAPLLVYAKSSWKPAPTAPIPISVSCKRMLRKMQTTWLIILRIASELRISRFFSYPLQF